MIITLANQKGGTAKSTIIINLAHTFAKTRDVVIIDLDVQKTSSSIFKIFEAQKLVKSKHPIKFLSFSSNIDMVKFLNKVEKDQLVLIDTACFDPEKLYTNHNIISALTLADFIITPVSNDICELLGLKTFEQILINLSKRKDLNGMLLKSLVLLNKIDPRVKNSIKSVCNFIEKSENFHLLKTILRYRADYKKSLNLGMAVWQYNKKGKAAKEIQNLVNEINSII